MKWEKVGGILAAVAAAIYIYSSTNRNSSVIPALCTLCGLCGRVKPSCKCHAVINTPPPHTTSATPVQQSTTQVTAPQTIVFTPPPVKLCSAPNMINQSPLKPDSKGLIHPVITSRPQGCSIPANSYGLGNNVFLWVATADGTAWWGDMHQNQISYTPTAFDLENLRFMGVAL